MDWGHFPVEELWPSSEAGTICWKISAGWWLMALVPLSEMVSWMRVDTIVNNSGLGCLTFMNSICLKHGKFYSSQYQYTTKARNSRLVEKWSVNEAAHPLPKATFVKSPLSAFAGAVKPHHCILIIPQYGWDCRIIPLIFDNFLQFEF